MSTHLDLERKVAFLHRPDAYEEAPDTVESIETHMAWVFLTDRSAYKLKKPVKLPFLDFSTLERREVDCKMEVALNRRLSNDVYHGIAPLSKRAGGSLELDGEGDVDDWLVHMRRLPQDRMLDERIRQETLTEDEIRRVAVLLTDFYRRTPPESISGREYVGSVVRDLNRDRDALMDPSYELPLDLVESIYGLLLEFVESEQNVLASRAESGRIVEAHGDLRPEHICVETRPVIFDCLEFSRDFRILDTAEELSFLAMECDRLGATFVGPIVMEVYGQISGDEPPPELLTFYKMHRACLRAKLAIWHLDDPDVDVAKWRRKAVDYLQLAASYRSLATRR